MKKILSIIILIFFPIVLRIEQIEMLQVGSLDHNPHFNSNYSIPVTTIERIESFPNGCYTQRVREPDLSNTKRFYEFDQFICPPSVNVSTITNGTIFPRIPYPGADSTSNFTKASVFQPQYIVPANNTPQTIFPHPYAPSAPLYYPSYTQPAAPVPFAAIPPPAVPSDSRPAVVTQNQINPSPVNQSFQPAGIPSFTCRITFKQNGFL